MFSQVIAKVRQVLQSGLQLVQQTIRAWTKPNAVALGALADMTRTKSELIAGNALLRQQLVVLHRSVKRPKLSLSSLDYPPYPPGRPSFCLYLV
jgi:putative transposase